MPTYFRILLVSLLVPLVSEAAQDSGGSRGSNSSGASNSSSRGDTSSNSGGNTSPNSPAAANLSVTDPSYSLNKGDTLYVSVGTHTNPVETSASPTIAKSGEVRLPWIDEDINIAGKTVRDAERFLEKLYKDRKLLNRPVVSVKVASYFLREISITGAVRSPGMMPFPPDTVSMDIADVISKVGGFSPIAKASDVTVYHREANGKEKAFTLDLESLRTGRMKAGKDRAEFLIYPGDRIFVPETIF